MAALPTLKRRANDRCASGAIEIAALLGSLHAAIAPGLRRPQIGMHEIIALVEDGLAFVAGEGVAEAVAEACWRPRGGGSTLFVGLSS